MSRYAVTDASNVVTNIVEWDGTGTTPAGAHVYSAPDNLGVNIGDTFDGTTVTPGAPSGERQARQNAATIASRAAAALSANATFLALGSPTNAQVLAQVQVLTKECTALIKLALGLLSDTTGT